MTTIVVFIATALAKYKTCRKIHCSRIHRAVPLAVVNDPADKAAIAAGMEQRRAFRLAGMRRRLGITQAPVAGPDGHHPGPRIRHRSRQARHHRTAHPAAYVEALEGRLEIIADFGDQRLAFTEPGTEAA
jgi:hypothetical protein